MLEWIQSAKAMDWIRWLTLILASGATGLGVGLMWTINKMKGELSQLLGRSPDDFMQPLATKTDRAH